MVPLINYPLFSMRKNHIPLKSFFFSVLLGIMFAGLFSAGFYVFAAPRVSPYNPGETLDPSCSVGEANCSVSPPVTTAVPYSGASGSVDLGSQAFSTTGTGTFGAFVAQSTSGAQQTLRY